MIYIIGHKKPDLDSVAAAISYANYKNKMAGTDIYVPAIVEDLNAETKYILEKTGFDIPEKIENVKGRDIILVDHNESSQTADGMDEANVIEVLDHHKMRFASDNPIEIKVLPWGSSCTIIADQYFKNKIEIEKNMAGLMLAAVLVDTVITKSPTCTEMDRDVIERLSSLSEIADWHAYGMEIFKVRSSVASLSVDKIVKADYKDFQFKSGKFGIGQVETADMTEVSAKEEELLIEMKRIKNAEAYHSVILFITDIINEGSKFLVVTEDEKKMEEALGTKLEGEIYLEGVMSRKKQVAPMLAKVFDE